MTGLLALIYSLARTREQANVMSSVILLVFAMVGGSMFPFENLPGFLQMAGQFTPNRWGVLALQGGGRIQTHGGTAQAAHRPGGAGRDGEPGCLFLFQTPPGPRSGKMKVLRIALGDLKRVAKDWQAILWLLAMPLAFAYIFGSTMRGGGAPSHLDSRGEPGPP